MTPELIHLRLAEVRPSKTNPRKDFSSAASAAYLDELAGTIVQHGVKQPALVRPSYCCGARTRAQIEAQRVTLAVIEFYELVFGECRWRASAIAEAPTLPCIVEEMTDDDAREVQQIENLARRDLNPIEEARGYAEMLTLINDDGTPRYTRGKLAEKLSRSIQWIHARLALLEIDEVGQSALKNGELTAKVASLIPAIYDPQKRAEFTARILKPDFEEGPLSWAKARALRERDYVKSLIGAPFDLADGELMPEAGACTGCPKMSGNCPQLFTDDLPANSPKQRTCLDPACYRAKLAALRAKQTATAKEDGKMMLAPEEAEKIYPFYMVPGEMDPKSPYVQIGRKPADALLKKEVTRVPTWEKLIAAAEEKTGARVPRVMIADQKGTVREHVDLRLAIAAIEKAGEPIFQHVDRREPKQPDAFAVEKKAEAERAKLRWAILHEALAAVWKTLPLRWSTEPVRQALFESIQDSRLFEARDTLMKWRGMDEAERAAGLQAWWRGLGEDEQWALLVLVLCSVTIKHLGIESDAFRSLAAALQIDLDAIEKQVVAGFKAKRPRLKPEEIEPKVRELLGDNKCAAEIAVALGLPKARAERIVAKIEKENAASKITTDGKILAEWTKAVAQGMSLAEIARSYKVPLADVKGALEGEQLVNRLAKQPAKKKKPGAGARAVAAVRGSMKRGKEAA